MTISRNDLHRLVDDLPEGDLSTAARVLETLKLSADTVTLSLHAAPNDDEPDNDDLDGGLSEARQEARAGRLLSHDEVKRQLGMS